MDTIKRETVRNILDKYIDRYDRIIESKSETRVRKCIAESEKSLIENIMEDLMNAKEDN